MPAAVEVVKLIGMKTQRAIGCKMKSDDPYHCCSIKEREGKTGKMFVDDRSPDVGHLGRLLPTTSGSASCLRLLLQFGPFISSAFVRPNTMPVGVRWFAENQPFTPMIETLRGLLLGTPIGNHAIIALAWCVAIALGGYLWARVTYNRDPIR